MKLLPRVSPAEFRQKWDGFITASDALGLDPHDRAVAWRQMTGDDVFHEWPVPADHFIANPYYVGENAASSIRPWFRDDVFATLADPDYEPQVLTIVAGVGVGKSTAAGLMTTYKLYELSCLRNPAQYLSTFPGCDLMSNSPIVLAINSAAGARQADKSIYAYVRGFVDDSPYFLHNFPPFNETQKGTTFDHRIQILPGTSSARSVIGLNVYAFVIDEAAFGTSTDQTDSVRELFQALHQRRRSRFGQLGLGGIFTSPGSEASFVEQMAAEGELSRSEVMVRRTTTWEAKGELKKGAKVFLVNTDHMATGIVETDLVYVAPGLAKRADGSYVRFGAGLGAVS